MYPGTWSQELNQILNAPELALAEPYPKMLEEYDAFFKEEQEKMQHTVDDILIDQ